MPAMRRYRVTETREVYVDANDLVGAVRIAGAAFEHGQNSDHTVDAVDTPQNVWGHPVTKIRSTDISAMED